jgi:TrpR-related protein YerC/YecD
MKKQINEDVKLKHFADALVKLKTANEVTLFVRDICTPNEIQSIVDRWEVAGLLTKNYSYRQIQNKTGVSVTTIGRVARYLNSPDGGYQIAMKRVNE